MGVEAPDWQGVKTQEYYLSFKFLQRSQAGRIGGQGVKLFLNQPLVHSIYPQSSFVSVRTAMSVLKNTCPGFR